MEAKRQRELTPWQEALQRRVGNPVRWSDADKCLIVVGIMLPGVGLIALMRVLFGEWLFLPPNVESGIRGLEVRLEIAGAIAWTAMGVAGWLLRTRGSSSPLFVHLTIQLYALTISGLVFLAGPFQSPGWVLVLGGGVLGLLLFGRPALLGLLTFVVFLGGLTVVAEVGHTGDVAIATSPPPVESPAYHNWLLRMSISTLLFSVMTLLLFHYVISLLRDREQRLERMARTDGLTGLYNRRHLMHIIERELKRSRRYELELSCIILDLDLFKSINDEYGHLVGDRVLVAVAEALELGVRDTDIVARYGGEEFVLLLPNTGRDGALELAERCRVFVAQADVDGFDRTVTASLGVATLEVGADETTVDALLHAADAALYDAKRSGRNKVVVSPGVAA